MISNDTIEEIKLSMKIEEIIDDFVSLKKRGSNYIGLCPFHDEKTPSFTVTPARNMFKCFGCGESGDGIAFLMKHEALNYPEALKFIAKKYHIAIEETKQTSEEIAKRTKKESLKIVTNFAFKVFRYNFKTTPGYKYMTGERKFKDNILNTFGIGYAKDSWTYLSGSATKRKFNPNFLLETGLAGKRQTDGGLFDRFRNRVIFPYFDIAGTVVGFTSRILINDKKQAKYINSSNSELFDKSKILYGLFQAKKHIVKQDYCFLVEGNTDVMQFHQIGIQNTVGTSGTALSSYQIKLIQRFTSHVILLFDADNAGQNAALKSIDKFIKQDFKVDIVILPDGEDPDSFALKNTKDEIFDFIENNKIDFFDYKVNSLLSDNPEAKEISKASKEISKTLAYINNKLERDIFTKRLVAKFNLNKELLNHEINELISTDDESPSNFFAYKEAADSIKKLDKAVLYDDNQKVIEKHLKNKKNTIGYNENINIAEFHKLKKLTLNITFENLLNEDDLIFKGKDTKLATLLKQLIVIGFNIEVKTFDETSNDSSNDYRSFIDSYISHLVAKINKSDDKSKKSAIEKAAEIISFLSETERMLKIDFIINTFKFSGYKISATDFKKILQTYLKSNERKSKKEVTIHASNTYGLSKQQLESIDKYGFFEKKNQLFFEEKAGGHVAFSNYTIKPLFHIESTNETRKLFEISNFKNETRIIEVDMESMIKIDKWQVYCESKGNYLFWGNKNHFIRLKQKLYANTKFCFSIENLGWQRENFWAWADGAVYDNKFLPVDEFGIVNVKNKDYYIPAFSKLYKNDKTVFKTERKFIRKQQDISFYNWSEKFINVFGENAKISTAGLMTAVYSDFIFATVGSLPLVNLFGVKGTGKTEQAISLLNFFGDRQNLLNIHKGTPYAAAVHLEYFKNAIAVIDEYKNSLDISKIEYLKSIYNRDGRLRGSIKAGVKTETTQVNSMVILCGQEMPTADVALFSRLVFLPHYKPDFTQEQKDKFNELKSIEKKGLTHLTEELLQYRELIEEKYEYEFYDIEKALSDELPSSIDGRLIKNYATIITTVKILESKIKFAFTYKEAFKLSLQRILEQYNIMNSSNEVSAFWESLVSLVERKIIKEGENYRLISETEVTLLVKEGGRTVEKDFNFQGAGDQPSSKYVLYLKMSTIYPYYAELAAKTRQDVMPKKSLEYYIEHSNAFLGRKKSQRFNKSITTGWALDYKKLGIDLLSSDDDGVPLDIDEDPFEEITTVEGLPF